MTSNQPHSSGAVTVPPGQVTTLLAALGEAAESRRDQAAMCADCADQSCATCQWCLQTADAYARLPAAGTNRGAGREAGQ